MENQDKNGPVATPGPWKLGYSHSVNDRHMGPDVLTVWPGSGPQGAQTSPICKVSPLESMSPTDLANAQLIIQAPQLKQALTDLVEALRASGQKLDSGAGLTVPFQPVTSALLRAETVLQNVNAPAIESWNQNPFGTLNEAAGNEPDRPVNILCHPGAEHPEPNRPSVMAQILAIMIQFDPVGEGTVASPTLRAEQIFIGQQAAYPCVYLLPKADWPSPAPSAEEVVTVQLTFGDPKSKQKNALTENYYLNRLSARALERILTLLEEGRLA